jgi:hypothetical protein
MITQHPGQSMIEIMVAVAAMVIFITATAGITMTTEKAVTEMTMEMQGISVAEEGIQASISIGDRAYSALAIGTHGLAISGSAPIEWIYSGTSDVANGFTRTIVISAVPNEPDMVKVSVTVTWHPEPNRTATVNEQILLTDWAFI